MKPTGIQKKCEHDYEIIKSIILKSELEVARVDCALTSMPGHLSVKQKHIVYLKCKKCKYVFYNEHVTA